MSMIDLAAFLEDFPLFWPGLGVSAVLSLIVCRNVGYTLHVTRPVASILVMATGLVLSATLTPSREALTFGAVGSGSCDLSRIWPAPLGELRGLDPTSLNLLLLVPLGIALAWLPSSQAKAALVIGALALPFAIEAIQLLVTPLDRACQSADAIDNVTGLLAGLVIGAVARRLSRGADRLHSRLQP